MASQQLVGRCPSDLKVARRFAYPLARSQTLLQIGKEHRRRSRSGWFRFWPDHFFGDLMKTEVASNYRGIALGSCVAKVFTRCLTRRLGEFAEERIYRGTRRFSGKEELCGPNTGIEGSV